MPTIGELVVEADRARETGDLLAAERLCRQILTVDSTQPDALHRLGLIAGQRGDLELALQYLSTALERMPHDASCHFNRAVMYRHLGKRAEAVADYQQATRL